MDDFVGKLMEAIEGEDLWLNFDTGSFVTDVEIREMIRTGKLNTDNVSSRPDVFPVFGNMDRAVKVLHKAVSNGTNDENDENDDECHIGVYGFKNPGSSCFMDSTLMAMFFLKNSPFYDGLFGDNMDLKTIHCSTDPQENARMKLDIKTTLEEDIQRIMSGAKGYKCSRLREMIGGCKTDPKSENMAVGMHDASEFFIRLLDVMGYAPMLVQESISHPEVPYDKPTDRSPQQEVFFTVLPQKDKKEHIKWPDYWSPLMTQTKETPILTRTDIHIVSADVFVVNVNRFSAVQGSGKNRKLLYNSHPIQLDREMNVTFTSGGKKTFRLKAAVYPPNPGHYAAILKCGEEWYNYDDLYTSTTYKNNLLTSQAVETILTTKATLLFYY